MEVQDFIAITVVGAGLSLIIDSIKAKFGTEGWATKSITLALSLIVGGLYVWLRQTSYFQTVIGVLGAASAVYAILLK